MSKFVLVHIHNLLRIIVYIFKIFYHLCCLIHITLVFFNFCSHVSEPNKGSTIETSNVSAYGGLMCLLLADDE